MSRQSETEMQSVLYGSDADLKNSILIKGARVHNLKNVDVLIPRNKLVVICGVSGSGKSSLTMDTLYAEGQRRYVESLSSYARQFLGRMNKPDVDYIKGICPAIAVEQKVSSRSTRSTVGSMTEIYDYLRLLFARIGKTYSPVSGNQVKKHEVRDVVDFIFSLKEGAAVYILIDLELHHNRSLKEELNVLIQKGFSRLMVDGEMKKIEELLESLPKKKSEINLAIYKILIDRLVVKKDDEDLRSRAADSAETAFFESNGYCTVLFNDGATETFSNKFEADGIVFEEPTQQFFNFNSPFGACKKCEGFGSVIGLDEDLIVPDKNLSVYEGAIACWRGEKMSEWQRELVKHAIKFDFPVHRSYKDLSAAEKKLLWTGNNFFQGLTAFFKHVEEQSFKIQYRVMMSRFMGHTLCPECGGSRIRSDAANVKISGKSISEVLLMPVSEAFLFFTTIGLNEFDSHISQRILREVIIRLQFMLDVGLGYLTIIRPASTLSGGETQRINLTRILGSNLSSSLYILDEPSIGLHPRDTARLVKTLKTLKNLGNTVVVVEHEEEVIRAADYIVDMGPLAGTEGGHVVYQGGFNQLHKSKESLTSKYLFGRMNIEVPKTRRNWSNSILLKGASQNNLKNIDVRFPLNALTVVSGVSGSGKTTLIKQILAPALKKNLEHTGEKPGAFESLEGDLHRIARVEMVDQNPIGRSSRSNPVTYIKAYDAVRELFAAQHAAKMRGFQPKHFSFNVDGGRCDYCKGEGEIIVEMQFLADVHLVCEDCGGKRFNEEVLEVTYKGKNIFEVLELTVDEAIDFFGKKSEVGERLQPLQDVGLGYVHLGQSSSTLSGGEAQRVKLASFLGKGKVSEPLLFIFDEPTTGLHFHDINKLLKAFNALIEIGHTILVIEHNMEIIKSADWVIELGPEGGDQGGYLVFEGTPENLAKHAASHTAEFLKGKL